MTAAHKHTVRLGPDVAPVSGRRRSCPRNAWQAADPPADWTLVGCTVAPGFEFAAFELAPKGWAPTFSESLSSPAPRCAVILRSRAFARRLEG